MNNILKASLDAGRMQRPSTIAGQRVSSSVLAVAAVRTIFTATLVA
jgi:hypothetical protein